MRVLVFSTTMTSNCHAGTVELSTLMPPIVRLTGGGALGGSGVLGGECGGGTAGGGRKGGLGGGGESGGAGGCPGDAKVVFGWRQTQTTSEQSTPGLSRLLYA